MDVLGLFVFLRSFFEVDFEVVFGVFGMEF